ncbi:MAG: condensation domain-containing protein [Bryobacteraceae bacterium]
MRELNQVTIEEPKLEDLILVPATTGQERFWVIDELGGDSALTMPLAWSISGPLNADVVEKVLDEIIRRHELLRTSFRVVDGKLMQVIHDSVRATMTIEDLSCLPESEQATVLRHYLIEEGRTRIPIETSPLVRLKLIRLSPVRHTLALSMHHMICDGWSNGIILTEFATLYEAFSKGKASPLPELPIQFADYAVWQQDQVKNGDFEPSIAYWRERMLPLPPVLELPVDHPRQWGRDNSGHIESLLLDNGLNEQLRTFCQRERLTLFIVTLAAFEILLSKYCDEQKFLLGSPFANRNHPETEGLIGLFANPQFIPADVSGGLSFRALLHRVRDGVVSSYDHQELPFEVLVESLGLDSGENRFHLPVYFILQKAFMQPQHLTDIVIHPERSVSSGTPFEMMMAVVERREGLRVQLEYRTTLFEAPTVKRFLRHYQILLERAVAAPDTPISKLSFLEEEERRHLLMPGWEQPTDTSADSLVSLAAHHAAQTPEAVAVEENGQNVTYATLHRESHAAAAHLAKLGVGQGDRVGLRLPPGVDLNRTCLALWQLGATVVPLESDSPRGRTAQMITRLNIRLAITTDGRSDGIPPDLATVSASGLTSETPATGYAESAKLGSAPAYVLPVSRAGRTAFVEISHRALLRLLGDLSDAIRLKAADRVACRADGGWDLALVEQWLPLTAGATSIRSAGVETATVVVAHPAVWRSLLTAGWKSRPGVRMIGGPDVLELGLAERLLEGGGRLWNLAGRAETTFSDLLTERTSESGPVRFRRSPGGLHLLVLDRDLSLCPISVTGEIYAAGESVMKGYIGDAALSQAGSVANPFGGGLLLRTGMRGRRYADGSLEVRGRVAEEVLLAGRTVSVEEVQTVLESIPGVVESLVLDLRGEVTAHVSAAGRSVDEIRAAAEEILPKGMVPPIKVWEKLPREEGGAIDRETLDKGLLSVADVAETADETESVLLGIWARLLRNSHIGVDDDFFRAGGTSLVAVRLLGAVREMFGRELKLATLAHAPTVRRLAAFLKAEGQEQPAQTVVPLQTTGDLPPLFCIYGVFLYYPLAQQLSGVRPVYGVYLPEEFDLLRNPQPEGDDTLLTNVEAQAAAYIEAIRKVRPQGPYYLAGESYGGIVAYEMAQQLHAMGEEVGPVVLLDTHAPGWSHRKPLVQRLGVHAQLAWREGLTYVVDKIKKPETATGVHGDEDLESLRRMARGAAMRKYSARPYDGPLVLLRAIERNQFETDDPQELWGWRRLAMGSIAVHHIPGDHLGILKKPNVEVLAAKLRESLDGAAVFPVRDRE